MLFLKLNELLLHGSSHRERETSPRINGSGRGLRHRQVPTEIRVYLPSKAPRIVAQPETLTDAREHVRRQLFFSAIFLGEVAGFWTFYFGAPAMASMIVGVAVILIVVAFNTWLRLSEQREAA